MKRRHCWACGRHRPMKKMQKPRGEPYTCAPDCGRAFHRSEARIVRLILSDHGEKDRKGWRKILARHVRAARFG